MNNFMDSLLSGDMIGIYALIAVVVLLLIIVFFVDKSHAKKIAQAKKQVKDDTVETETITNDVEIVSVNKEEVPTVQVTTIEGELKPVEVSEEKTVENIVQVETNDNQNIKVNVTPNTSSMELVQEIKYVDEDLEQTRAQEELVRLTKELEQACKEVGLKEEVPQEVDLAKHTDFELMQEENAIISLNELMQKGNTIYQANEETQYKDEGNEPINLQELEARYQKQTDTIVASATMGEVVVNEKVTLDDFNTVKTSEVQEENTGKYKFKNSPIISPVFGIEKNVPVKNNLELENTANYDKLDAEIRKTNEFIELLKDLQKKLD